MSKSTWWILGGIALLYLWQRQQQNQQFSAGNYNNALFSGINGVPMAGITTPQGDPSTFYNQNFGA